MEDVEVGEERRLDVDVADSAVDVTLLNDIFTFVGDHRSPLSTMSRGFPLVRMVVYSTGSKGHPSVTLQGNFSHRNPVMAFGYVLMKSVSRSIENLNPLSLDIHSFFLTATVPTPEQTYDALAPDLKKQVDAARAARLARESMTAEHQAQASGLGGLIIPFHRN